MSDTQTDLDKLLGRAEVAALAKKLYGHVLECIDFGRLYGLEQQLWRLVGELEIQDDLGELAKALIQRAIVRASNDPAAMFRDVPDGISKAEEKAANFDESCPFCQYEAAYPHEDKEDTHSHGGEACALCDDLANDWRTQHAEALRAGARRLAQRAEKAATS